MKNPTYIGIPPDTIKKIIKALGEQPIYRFTFRFPSKVNLFPELQN